MIFPGCWAILALLSLHPVAFLSPRIKDFTTSQLGGHLNTVLNRILNFSRWYRIWNLSGVQGSWWDSSRNLDSSPVTLIPWLVESKTTSAMKQLKTRALVSMAKFSGDLWRKRFCTQFYTNIDAEFLCVNHFGKSEAGDSFISVKFSGFKWHSHRRAPYRRGNKITASSLLSFRKSVIDYDITSFHVQCRFSANSVKHGAPTSTLDELADHKVGMSVWHFLN